MKIENRVVPKRKTKPKQIAPIVAPKRSDEVELARRVDFVYGLLVSGSRRDSIVQDGSEKWGITERQVDDYIAMARVSIKTENAKTREEAFSEHIAYRRKLRGLAESDKDWRAALASAQDEAKLQDLYPSEKHAIEQSGQMTIKIVRDGKADTPTDSTPETATDKG